MILEKCAVILVFGLWIAALVWLYKAEGRLLAEQLKEEIAKWTEKRNGPR